MNMIKPKNLIKALWEQLPVKRAYRNFFITGNAWGMFSENSHRRADTQDLKNEFPTKDSAIRAAEQMSAKYGKHFSSYKCVYCDGYHIGRNRDNK